MADYIRVSELPDEIKRRLVQRLNSRNFRILPSSRPQITSPSPFHWMYRTGTGSPVYRVLSRYSDLSYRPLPPLRSTLAAPGAIQNTRMILDAIDAGRPLLTLTSDGDGPLDMPTVTEYELYVRPEFVRDLRGLDDGPGHCEYSSEHCTRS